MNEYYCSPSMSRSAPARILMMTNSEEQRCHSLVLLLQHRQCLSPTRHCLPASGGLGFTVVLNAQVTQNMQQRRAC